MKMWGISATADDGRIGKVVTKCENLFWPWWDLNPSTLGCIAVTLTIRLTELRCGIVEGVLVLRVGTAEKGKGFGGLGSRQPAA